MLPFEESLVQVMDMMFDVSSLFDFLVTIVVYVFYALGLSRMAKACHHPRPWMAWVPYADYYLTGELAELSAIRYRKKRYQLPKCRAQRARTSRCLHSHVGSDS